MNLEESRNIDPDDHPIPYTKANLTNLHHIDDTNLIHLNSNLLCSVDCITTGPDVKNDALIQVCVLPLNAEIRPHKGILPFYQDLKPKRPERIDFANRPSRMNQERIFEAAQKGTDADKAVDRFEKWFEKIHFRFGKKLCIVCHNYPKIREFLIDWLGFTGFQEYFSVYYRDLIPATLFANDRADSNFFQIPYPKSNLAHICSQLKVEHETLKHDALMNCVSIAECYRLMLRQVY